MSFRKRFPTLLAVAVSLWLAAPLAASAQDVMELDLAFKNGQLPTSQGQARATEFHDRSERKAPLELVRRHRRSHRPWHSVS
jgi:hypothetical protein